MIGLVLAATTALAQPLDLPADSFQRAATKALAGQFGKLKPWQATGYRLGLKRGTTCSTYVWITHYSADEGRDGRIDNKGNACTRRTAAANEIPRGSYVWIEDAGELRQILDSGSRRNDRIGRGKDRRVRTPGWVDVWYKHGYQNPFGGSCVGRIAIIGKE